MKLNRDPTARTQATYDDLVEGTEYEYRVLAENEAGVSKPSETTGVFVAKVTSSVCHACSYFSLHFHCSAAYIRLIYANEYYLLTST